MNNCPSIYRNRSSPTTSNLATTCQIDKLNLEWKINLVGNKINNFEKINWLLENHLIFPPCNFNKIVPPTLPFEIGKPTNFIF